SPTSISIRPMYHHSDKCIRAHVFVCVLSLLLISLLRLRLTRQSVAISYDELLDELRSIHAIKIELSKEGGSLWRLESTTGLALKLIKKLKLSDLLKLK
ncbi:MAG: hypothetical protein ACTSO2_20125, partial [Promethearchaeota archaeon]